MTLGPKLRIPLLSAALAASVASAFAAYNSSLVPGPNVAPRPATTMADPTPQPVPAGEAVLAPGEELVTVDGPEAIAKEAVVTRATKPSVRSVVDAPAQPSIEITRPRLTIDQRVQADVMDLLARNPNLSGKIGVVSEGSVVTLSGYTATPGQAWRAGRDARNVRGVRHVVNEIRPRVGGITS